MKKLKRNIKSNGPDEEIGNAPPLNIKYIKEENYADRNTIYEDSSYPGDPFEQPGEIREADDKGEENAKD